MEFRSTTAFDNDVKKLDRHERLMLGKLLEKIKVLPELGKPLEHHANVFSKRTTNRRLVWQVKRQDGEIILLLYKNRDEAYEALRQMSA